MVRHADHKRGLRHTWLPQPAKGLKIAPQALRDKGLRPRLGRWPRWQWHGHLRPIGQRRRRAVARGEVARAQVMICWRITQVRHRLLY